MADVFIPRDLLQQLQRAEQGHAILDERAERAGKLRVVAEAQDAAVNRHAPHEEIPRFAPFRRAGEDLPRAEQPEARGQHDPPVVHDDVVGIHEDLRGRRERLAAAFEEAGELRDHHCHEGDDEPDACDDEHGGIDERLLHAVAQRLHIGQMRDEALEDVGQRAADLARGDEIHVEG